MVESQAAADVAFPSAASLDITSFVKNEYFICGNEINQSIIYRIFSMIVKRVSTQSGINIPYNCHFFYTDTIFGE